MRIESYSFGSISIDGTVYSSDVILLRGKVHGPWWRQAGGHVFASEDLAKVLAAAPDVVVLGTGYLGLARVRDELLQALDRVGTEVVVGRTGKIVGDYNRLAEDGRDVAAALHLTC